MTEDRKVQDGRVNRGALWPTRNRDRGTKPHFNGSLNVAGVEYWVNCWAQEPGANNSPVLTLAMREKDGQTNVIEQPQTDGMAILSAYVPGEDKGVEQEDKQKSSDLSDDIPF